MQGTQTQGTDMHTNAAAFAPKYPQLGSGPVSRKAELAMGEVVRSRAGMWLATTAWIMPGDVGCLMLMSMPKLRALHEATTAYWIEWAELQRADLGRAWTDDMIAGIREGARRQADIVATVLYVREEARRGTQVWDLLDAYATIMATNRA